jgi:TPR repeat protein
LYDELYKEINKDFSDELAKSLVPNKAKILSDIKQILDKIEILVLYPELIEKTVIGVMGSDPSTFHKVLSKLVSEATLKKMILNTNVPSICLHLSSDEVEALNVLGKKVQLNDTEYREVTRQLYKYKIDIRNLIKAFSVPAEISLDNCLIAHFPEHTQKFQDFHIALEEKVDYFMVYAEKGNNRNLKHLHYLQNNSLKPVLVILEETYKTEFLKAHPRLRTNISLITVQEMEGVLKSIDRPCINYTFVDEIRLSLLEIDQYYTSYTRKLKKRLANINADLVKIDHDDTNEKAKNIRNSLKHTIENAQDSYSGLKAEMDALVRKALSLEALFEQAMKLSLNNLKKVNLYHNNMFDVWSKLALRLIEAEDYRLAKDYVDRLREIEYPYSYILDLLISHAKNEMILGAALAKLQNEEENVPLVQRAKIVLGRELGLNANDYISITTRIRRPTTALECYYKALGLESSNMEQAIRLYFQALEMEHMPSGERLYELYKVNKNISLEFLAQNMVPIANYELGMQIKDKKYAKGITNLKIAASYGYLPAIKVLADDFYGKVVSNYYKNLSEKEMKEKYDNVFELYQYIISKEPNNLDAIEKLGHLFFKLEDYRRSMEYLQECNTAYALYRCGNMYQYGKGTTQDLEKAKEYFDKAHKKGHPKAKAEYDKVIYWIESNSSRRSSYNSHNNYSPRSSYSSSGSSSGGFCFITTATCLALNKEDDCPELMLMKKYRDFMKERDENVALLIKEYYRIAPLIVKAIDADPDSKKVYLFLWENYIKKTYKNILEESYAEATYTYISMMLYLCDKFSVTLADDIPQRISFFRNGKRS